MSRILGLILLWLALAGPAAAQGPRVPDADIQATLSQSSAVLRETGAGFRTDQLSDEEIKSRLARIAPVEAKLATALSDLTPRLQDVQARLNQLGPAPPPGHKEDPHTEQLRRQLTRVQQIFEADQREAKLLTVEGQQISDVLTERLRENFQERLTSQSRSVLDPSLWRNLAISASGDLSRLAGFVSDQSDAIADEAKSAHNVTVWAVAAILAVVLLIPARIVLIGLGVRRARRDASHSRLTRALLALWRILVGVLTPLLAIMVIRAALLNTDALTEAADTALALLVRAAGFGFFIESLGRSLVSAGRSEWRLAPIPDKLARRLAIFPALIGFTAGLATFVAGFNADLNSSQSAQVVSGYAAVILEIAAVGGALVALGRARVERVAAGEIPVGTRAPWVIAALAAWLSLAVSIGAVLIGYLAFAEFLLRETIWIAAVFGLLLLLLRIADDLIPALLASTSPFGGAVASGLGLSPGAVDQTAVLASGVARLVLILIGWMAIVAPFGASAGDIFGRMTSTNFILRFGKVEVSPVAVLGAIALFFIGLAATRAVRGWLESRYLPKTQLDVGVRTSLSAGVTYLGGFIAILVAFAYLGLSVSQIALFASALSVGIGFGLQSIIGNFVSGLILLAERPVRVGDWIAIGDMEGDVQKISIRATEIEMTDRSRLIVPNTDLVSKTVRNVTHSGALGRLKLVIKVVDTADPAQVRDLILARVKAQKGMLKDPAPAVYMTDLRDGFMEFTAFAYMATPRNVFGAKSDILFQLVPELRGAGIPLYSNTPVVNVGLDRPIEPGAPTHGA
ncbi:MAG: mechanosensitive ion channel family protein [Caulobacteraceae bacterium]|nr:mechanosensitive ion channel family protein [Caulobacteraceae bacterium]